MIRSNPFFPEIKYLGEHYSTSIMRTRDDYLVKFENSNSSSGRDGDAVNGVVRRIGDVLRNGSEGGFGVFVDFTELNRRRLMRYIDSKHIAMLICLKSICLPKHVGLAVIATSGRIKSLMETYKLVDAFSIPIEDSLGEARSSLNGTMM